MISKIEAAIPRRVLLLENIAEEASLTFKKNGYEVETVPKSLNSDELGERLQDFDFLGIRSGTKITEKVVGSMKRLSAIGAFCIGTAQINKEMAKEAGIPVFNDPVSNGRSVAELALGHIISLSRRINDVNSNMHNGKWDKSVNGACEVRGKTLGIVGYGKIGSQLSNLAENLGMKVIFYDIRSDIVRQSNAEPKNRLEEVLQEADFVSVHVDDRNQNRNLFTSREFGMMKPGAFFINLSRGFVVDEEALADSLNAGHLRGAAIDVFQHEPSQNNQEFNSPLRGIPNVILTSHIGGNTVEAQRGIARYVSGKLMQFDQYGDTTGSVNFPEVGLYPHPDSHRFTHVHANEKGLINAISGILYDGGINIMAQELRTDEKIGYVVFDINQPLEPVVEEINKIPHTIRARVLY